MLTRHRLTCLFLLLACCGGCRLVTASAAPGCSSCDGPFPRPQDQIWLVSTRHLGSVCCEDPAAGDVRIHRYDSRQGWIEADAAAFYASDDPEMLTCFYVHAARVDHQAVAPRGFSVYRGLVSGTTPAPAMRLVIWSWPADKTVRVLQDFRRLAERADSEACYLGRFLSGIDPNVRVSLVGFSMGPRIINGALHLLGGGTLRGVTLPEDQGKPRVRVRAVLWAPAVDCCWLWPGQCHGKALVQVDHMLAFYNLCDPVLSRYAMLDRCTSAEALGYAGVPQPERLGEARSRIETRGLDSVLGKVHSFDRYVASPFVMEHTRGWALWKTADPDAAAAQRGLENSP